MSHGFEALGAGRPAAAPLIVGDHVASHSATRSADDRRVVWWLVLLPLNSVVMIGLLVLALSWMVGGPAAPALSAARADVDAAVDPPVVDEIEIGEQMMRFGPVFTR